MNSTLARLKPLKPLSSLAALVLLMPACSPKPESTSHFRLPVGDIEEGRSAFVELKCHLCHRVKGAKLPAVPETPRIDVPLGGEVYRVTTYGELLTAVVHPKHVVDPRWEFMKDEKGTSIMPDYNDRMTVDQMIDIVAFLHSHYEVIEPDWPESYAP